MQFRSLGTSAANAFPEPFCRCPNCRQARRLGDPSLRRRSSKLINDDLLIDLGPDILTASHAHNIKLFNVRYCLHTHGHPDHLDLSHLVSRSPKSGIVNVPCLAFYAAAAPLERADHTFRRDQADYGLLEARAETELNLTVHRVEPLRPYPFGPYRLTAFPAKHAPALQALLYSIECEDRALFYATDTAALPNETWDALREQGALFDLIVLDHAYGLQKVGSNHLSAAEFAEYVRRLRREELPRPNGRVLANHIAHDGNPAHPELARHTANHGYEVAYDGLSIHL